MITQPNVVNSRILYDSGEKTIVQIIGYYTAACSAANTVVVDPKTLRFANTQQYCSVSVDTIQYHSSLGGFVSLEWEGTTNSSFFILGVGAGTMPLGTSNEAIGPTGNIKAMVVNIAANDSFSATLTLLKGSGFANASAWFGDGRP
jgi:hypothetical protein